MTAWFISVVTIITFGIVIVIVIVMSMSPVTMACEEIMSNVGGEINTKTD